MKKLFSILAVLAAASLLWLGWRWMEGRQPPLDEPSVVSWQGDPPTKIENEPVKIFQRAFWASPTEDDRILHAERREWSNAEGTQKWQWFLVVKPSPTLIKRLRDDNAFGLTAAPSVAGIANAPEWFAFDASESVVMKSKSPVSNMQLIFSKNGKSLHATDSGLGFRPGAPDPVTSAPPPSSPAPGRLPVTPPPTPNP